MNREFLQLAHNYDPKKHVINGWFASEKLDGMRAFWDGGVTRGMPCSEVPFANTKKDSRLVHAPIATGLWSRYGKPIHAPDDWLDWLPPIPLDGELYLGRGNFQTLVSTVKTLVPGSGWNRVTFHVFDAPEYQEVFANGRINNPNFQKEFVDLIPWFQKRTTFSLPRKFIDNVELIQKFSGHVVKAHPQHRLSNKPAEEVFSMLTAIIDQGGEGLILRAPYSYWTPKRTSTLLKVKALHDDEATVVGYTWGRETDKGSKLLGKMGALIVEWKGKRFELSGFTDEERELSFQDLGAYLQTKIDVFSVGSKHPGEIVSIDIWNPTFPRGSKITFKYRELTDDGIPKEARYFRRFD